MKGGGRLGRWKDGWTQRRKEGAGKGNKAGETKWSEGGVADSPSTAFAVTLSDSILSLDYLLRNPIYIYRYLPPYITPVGTCARMQLHVHHNNRRVNSIRSLSWL
eukprot:GHVU01184218.1.p1 GENE.GHVU01184218.1~~GHVU01184218.1.p1  ORF type:complete len:105 (-),score=3.12 GHVU01184218.1:467-781(-)